MVWAQFQGASAKGISDYVCPGGLTERSDGSDYLLPNYKVSKELVVLTACQEVGVDFLDFMCHTGLVQGI